MKTDGSLIVADDVAHVVHPLTPLGGEMAKSVTVIVGGDGIRVQDAAGRKYIDACSGLWNVNVGYGRAELAEAAAEQLRNLGYATLYINRGNAPAARLATKLAEITPGNIARFFFSLGGSDANDTAIKLARFYNARRGHPEKYQIIARQEGYHGSTFGAMSATGETEFWRDFGPLLPGFTHIEQPQPDDRDAAQALEAEIVRLGSETVAAFIAEPICVPAGVSIPPATYWPAIRDVCTRYDVLLIADEVITGFGRTGRFFGLEHWDVVPDLLVVSKGLTSGYLPLGAVGMSSDFYEVISEPDRPFMHGFTTGGHPACCAVALRNIEIIEDELLIENARVVGDHLKVRLQAVCPDSSDVPSVRGLGMMAALDLAAEGKRAARFEISGLGKRVETELRERGVLVRAFGDTIAIAPPLITTVTEIDEIVDTIRAVIGSIT